MYMPLGEDVKHVKHISNEFDIFAADTDQVHILNTCNIILVALKEIN